MLGRSLAIFCRSGLSRLTRVAPKKASLLQAYYPKASFVRFLTKPKKSQDRETKNHKTPLSQTTLESAAIKQNEALDRFLFSAAFQRIIKALEVSWNLKEQQKMFGECLKKPLPLSEELKFENHFMDDVLNTEAYKDFCTFVLRIKCTSKPNLQELFLGGIAHASICGKTHFARVYTRYNKAIYLNIFQKTPGPTIAEDIVEQIEKLDEKLSSQMEKNSVEYYKEFTHKSMQLLKTVFLTAINFYAEGLEKALNMKLSEKESIALCSQLFDGDCRDHFMQQVKKAWQNMDDDTVTKLWHQAQANIDKHQISAIFCDDVHRLKHYFVGKFCHSGLSHTDRFWGDVSALVTNVFINFIHSTRFHCVLLMSNTTNEFDSVKNAFAKPTSLLYLLVDTFESIGAAGIGCIMLTTDLDSLNFQERTLASMNRARIFPFELKRTADEEIKRQRAVIKNHFGIDYYGFFKEKKNSDQLLNCFGNHVLYFKVLLGTIVKLCAESKPSHSQLTKLKEEIWFNSVHPFTVFASHYTAPRLKQKNLYLDVLYATRFHFGCVKYNSKFDELKKVVGLTTFAKSEVNDQPVWRISDFWLTVALTRYPPVAKGIINIVSHKLAEDKRELAEDLIKALALIHYEKNVTDLAVEGSQFHQNSFALQCQLQVETCGDLAELGVYRALFAMAPLMTVTDLNFIKVDNALFTRHSMDDKSVLSMWTWNNWNKLQDDVDCSWKGDFATPHSDWDTFVRVIVAAEFSANAIAKVNEHNLKENCSIPIVLIPISRLPKELMHFVDEEKNKK